ncbi:MAG: c(7)-type cytochrome triheme domain-containing protein [Thermodesulfobacteriota bacterium]
MPCPAARRLLASFGLLALGLCSAWLAAARPLMAAAPAPPGSVLFTKPIKAVLFQHRTHDRPDIGCEACHPDPFSRQAGQAEADPDFTMAAMAAGRLCGRCHDGRIAFAVTGRCQACHVGAVWLRQQTPSNADGRHPG